MSTILNKQVLDKLENYKPSPYNIVQKKLQEATKKTLSNLGGRIYKSDLYKHE